MTSTIEDQRGANFPKFTKPLYEDMKKIFKTKDGTVIMWPSSGTGSWEACLINTLSPGDKGLTSRFGQFSFLWMDVCLCLRFTRKSSYFEIRRISHGNR